MKDIDPSTQPQQAPIYQIRLRGHLGRRWSEWFEDWNVALEDEGDTVLTGPVADQATLHGTLKRVRDLGLPLVSVVQIDPDETPGTGADAAPDAGSAAGPDAGKNDELPHPH